MKISTFRFADYTNSAQLNNVPIPIFVGGQADTYAFSGENGFGVTITDIEIVFGVVQKQSWATTGDLDVRIHLESNVGQNQGGGLISPDLNTNIAHTETFSVVNDAPLQRVRMSTSGLSVNVSSGDQIYLSSVISGSTIVTTQSELLEVFITYEVN